MPLETVTLLAAALTDTESARDYLRLDDDTNDPAVIQLVNEATGRIERYCMRKLRSRTYGGATVLVVSGDDTDLAVCPEYPVTTLTSIKARDSSGGLAALSITGARLSRKGIIQLPNDVFPSGSYNVEIECVAGYLAGTHDSELADLERACRRLVQVGWQDYLNKVGRGTGFDLQGMRLNLIDAELPKDVAGILDGHRRPE